MPDVTASSDMTDALGKVEETDSAVKMSKEGIRPLSLEEKAQASSEASPEGVPAEKAASPPEKPPVQESQPRVEVVTATAPQDPPAKDAPVAGEPKEEPKEDNMAEALKKLTEFGDARAEEVRRAAQGAADKNAAQFDRLMKESDTRAQKLTDDIRELGLRDLTEEERVKAREAYAQEDERAELDSKAVQLEDLAKATIVDSLMFEYRDYGISRNDLEALDSAEEMELYCAHAANDLLAEKLTAKEEEKKEEPAAAKTEEPPAEQPKPEPRVANAPGVPAGAQSPSDVGTSGAAPQEKKFSEEQGSGHLLDNLKNARWDTVRIR